MWNVRLWFKSIHNIRKKDVFEWIIDEKKQGYIEIINYDCDEKEIIVLRNFIHGGSDGEQEIYLFGIDSKLRKNLEVEKFLQENEDTDDTDDTDDEEQ